MSRPSETEQELRRAAEAGEGLNLTRRGNNVVSARAIRDLVRSPDLTPYGVRLVGARIVDALDLSEVTSKSALVLRKCVFEAPPDLTMAEVSQLCLDSSHLPGLRAFGLRTSNLLIRAARLTGTVQLAYADVAGVCDFSETGMRVNDQQALHAPSLRVGNDLLLDGLLAESSTAAPTVDLTASSIGGAVMSARTAAVNGRGAAISLRRATVGTASRSSTPSPAARSTWTAPWSGRTSSFADRRCWVRSGWRTPWSDSTC